MVYLYVYAMYVTLTLCCVSLAHNPSCLAMLLACNIRVRYDLGVMLCLCCVHAIRLRVMQNEHLCCVYAIKARVVRVRETRVLG